MLISYNWLKEYTGDTTKTAQEAADLIGTHSFEIEGIEEKGSDTVIEIDILPNRASDALCHRGIARELATITGKELANDLLATEPDLKYFDQIEVNIEDSNACPRFTASLITGVKIKESPDWLKTKLEMIGQRSINNIVDATNYVMFSMGQPMHAYDADLFPQVDGKWQMGIRLAQEGETVSLIAEGGKDEDRIIELKGTEQLIVDNSSNTPIGLAGVKGGRFAGVHEGTTKIILEAAHFHPTVTRKTARRLGIVIDASKRFENEPSRELPLFAQSQIIKLITDIAGGEYVGTIDKYLEKQTSVEVEVSVERTNSHLGLNLSSEVMVDILKRTGCKVSLEGDMIKATGPFERTDLNIEEDFIEEIGRIHGYAHVDSISPEPVPLKTINKRHYYSEFIRETLIGLGFSEVITSSFRKKDIVQLHNALASDKSCLRSTLTKNIEEALDKNAGFNDLLGVTDTRVFEIGTVFYSEDDTVKEHLSLAFGVRLKASGYSGKEDKILSQVVEEVNKKLSTEVEFILTKGIAECNVTKLLKTVSDVDKYEHVTMGEEVVYKTFSQFPSMSRDIAMWVGEGVTREEVIGALNEAAGSLRARTTFVDEFAKDGKTSLAFRLVFQSENRTLTDGEVGEVMEGINKTVEEKGWEVR
jgi:phenylalanyl-tRNA synthetase beta chain